MEQANQDISFVPYNTIPYFGLHNTLSNFPLPNTVNFDRYNVPTYSCYQTYRIHEATTNSFRPGIWTYGPHTSYNNEQTTCEQPGTVSFFDYCVLTEDLRLKTVFRITIIHTLRIKMHDYNIIKPMCRFLITTEPTDGLLRSLVSRFGGVMVTVLVTETKVRAFRPGRGDGFLRAIKIRSTLSFGEAIKPEAPCRKILRRPLGHDSFLPNSFQFTIHLSPFHSKLYSYIVWVTERALLTKQQISNKRIEIRIQVGLF
jgi:hypothetical protein